MSHVHATVRITDQLRAAAEELNHLDDAQIISSDDPLTVFRNLHATLAALRDAWPALSESAGFEDFFNQEDVAFTEEIKHGLQITVEGLWAAQGAI